MVCIISPSKTMDTENESRIKKTTIPEYLDKAAHLTSILEKYERSDLSTLMKLSDKLASQTFDQYKELIKNNCKGNAPAIYSYTGEVYTGLKAIDFNPEDLIYAKDHLRILSGLYGILRPTDGILPYRLEMATKIQPNENQKSLYQYWSKDITSTLNQLIKKNKCNYLANLASDEYMKVVNIKELAKPVVHFEFYEIKNGEKKFISFNAKRARGIMAAFIIKNQIQNPHDLKLFCEEGYYFDPAESTELNLTYILPENKNRF